MTTIAVVVAVAVARATAAVTWAAAVAMVMAKARGTATAAVLVAACGGGRGNNGTTIRYAIHWQYADIVNVRSNNNDNHAPTTLTSNGGNFDREGDTSTTAHSM